MSAARKTSESVSIPETFAVNTREANVAIEGFDASAIAGSFAVHLVKDGRRIASRFFFQASDGADAAQSLPAPQLAHFDFILPIDVLADGKLTVEIEPVGSTVPEKSPLSEQTGHPTLRVYLMLESD
jgi:hypothetical protein